MLYENKMTFTFPFRGLPFRVDGVGLNSTFDKIDGLNVEWLDSWNKVPSKEELEGNMDCLNTMDWLGKLNDEINYGGNNLFVPTYDRNNYGLVWLECNNGRIVNSYITGMKIY